MVERLKIIYSNNKLWIHLLRYLSISLVMVVAVLLVDRRVLPVHEVVPEVLTTSVALAQDILGILAGALLSMTTFTFSTIMVVLTMYSNSFSPRVVDNFLGDKVTIKVLGVFVGGFFYSITTLFFMRNTMEYDTVVAATVAILYAIFCIIYFIVFVYSVSSSIQATTLIARLYDEAYGLIGRTLDFRLDHEGIEALSFEEEPKQTILSEKSGYLEVIDFQALQSILEGEAVKLVIHPRIGDFIGRNTVLATLHGRVDEARKDLHEKVLGIFALEEKRMIVQDYRFSMEKIVDVALRAMSPGINDPNTCIHCVRILGVLLGQLARIDGDFVLLAKEKSTYRILYQDICFHKDLYDSLHQIVIYGKGDVTVMSALLHVLENVRSNATPGNVRALRAFAGYVKDHGLSALEHPQDQERIKGIWQRI